MGFMTLVPHMTHILFISNFTGTSRKNGFQSVPPHKNRPVFNSSGPKIILWILSTNQPRKTFLAKGIETFQVLRWLKYCCYLAFNDCTKYYRKPNVMTIVRWPGMSIFFIIIIKLCHFLSSILQFANVTFLNRRNLITDPDFFF